VTLVVSGAFVFIKPYRFLVASFSTLCVVHKYFSYPYITKQSKNSAKSHLANAVSQRLCASLTPFVFGSNVFLQKV
jgi:cytochrome bd-type quinol oxidase subunit 1